MKLLQRHIGLAVAKQVMILVVVFAHVQVEPLKQRVDELEATVKQLKEQQAEAQKDQEAKDKKQEEWQAQMDVIMKALQKGWFSRFI
jgi:hypothetical protein